MTNEEIKMFIQLSADVQNVSYDENEDEWHAFGTMPNSIEEGWYLVGRTDEIKAVLDRRGIKF